jgi:hypothetical protein
VFPRRQWGSHEISAINYTAEIIEVLVSPLGIEPRTY